MRFGSFNNLMNHSKPKFIQNLDGRLTVPAKKSKTAPIEQMPMFPA